MHVKMTTRKTQRTADSINHVTRLGFESVRGLGCGGDVVAADVVIEMVVMMGSVVTSCVVRMAVVANCVVTVSVVAARVVTACVVTASVETARVVTDWVVTA
jgi:hypothetical protein